MPEKYNVIIVGAGPAGIFAALELAKSGNTSILLLEKGKDIDERISLVSGLGGSGAFSDGKLTLSTQVGGRLSDYIGQDSTQQVINHVDGIYEKYGGSSNLYGTGDELEAIASKAYLAGLRLVSVPIRHLGTENCRSILRTMRDELLELGVHIKLDTAVATILTTGRCVDGIITASGDQYFCDYLVIAPGREGSEWLRKQADTLELTLLNNPVDVGVRVEVPYAILSHLTDILYEAKFEYVSKSFDDPIRTFCMCPGGQVVTEITGGDDPVITVNGHSGTSIKSVNTNFALLVSTNFTKPFHEPVAYGKYLARLANILSGGVLIQRFGDLVSGQRSTETRIARGLVKPTLPSAVPGDISFVMPYRQMTGIVEMINALDKLAPGVASGHTLLYAVEVKFCSYRLKLTSVLETEIENMFGIGDGCGISRGLIQAAASGVIASREIILRSSKDCY